MQKSTNSKQCFCQLQKYAYGRLATCIDYLLSSSSQHFIHSFCILFLLQLSCYAYEYFKCDWLEQLLKFILIINSSTIECCMSKRTLKSAFHVRLWFTRQKFVCHCFPNAIALVWKSMRVKIPAAHRKFLILVCGGGKTWKSWHPLHHGADL